METVLLKRAVGGAHTSGYVRNGDLPAHIFDFHNRFFTQAFSVSRASAATFFSQTGSLVTVSENEARLGPGGLLLEDAATNLWDGSVTTQSQLQSVGPEFIDSGMSFTPITDDGDGFLQFDAVNISGLSNSAIVRYSIVLRDLGAGQVDFWVGIGTTGSARLRYTLDLTQGTVAAWGNPDNVTSTGYLVPLAPGTYRAIFEVPLVSADTTELCRLTSFSGSVAFAHPQAEAGPVVSTPIASGETERAADVVSFSIPDGTYDWSVKLAGQSETIATVTLVGGAPLGSPLTGVIERVLFF